MSFFPCPAATGDRGYPRSDFVGELRANPEISIGLLTAMSRRLRELDENSPRARGSLGERR